MDKNFWDKAVNTAVTNLGMCAKLLEIIDKEHAEEYIKKFDKVVDRYSEMDITHKSTLEALQETKEYFADEDNELTIPYNKIFDERLKEKPQLTPENIKTHKLRDLFIQELRGENPEENTGGEDDDIISTNQFVPPTDPISKEMIRNPVKNTHCGHIYDKYTITQMLAQRRIRCPYIGCPSKDKIQMERLEDDVELKRKIDRYCLKNYTLMCKNSGHS